MITEAVLSGGAVQMVQDMGNRGWCGPMGIFLIFGHTGLHLCVKINYCTMKFLKEVVMERCCMSATDAITRYV